MSEKQRTHTDREAFAKDLVRAARAKALDRVTHKKWSDKQFTDRNERLAAALNIYLACGVKQAGPYLYHVARENKGYYEVDQEKQSCTCADHSQGHKCKHRLAAWIFSEVWKLREREEEQREKGR